MEFGDEFPDEEEEDDADGPSAVTLPYQTYESGATQPWEEHATPANASTEGVQGAQTNEDVQDREPPAKVARSELWFGQSGKAQLRRSVHLLFFCLRLYLFVCVCVCDFLSVYFFSKGPCLPFC